MYSTPKSARALNQRPLDLPTHCQLPWTTPNLHHMELPVTVHPCSWMKKASCSDISGMLEGLIFACFHGVSLFGVFTREIWGGGKITYIVDYSWWAYVSDECRDYVEILVSLVCHESCVSRHFVFVPWTSMRSWPYWDSLVFDPRCFWYRGLNDKPKHSVVGLWSLAMVWSFHMGCDFPYIQIYPSEPKWFRFWSIALT